jgi:hypothetical protein
MRLLVIGGIWLIVLGIGGAGLAFNQMLLMGICIVAWTPLALAFGYSFRGLNMRVSFGDDEEVQPFPQPDKESLLKRQSRIRQERGSNGN